ncbi:MAG: hypothetical protein WCE63_22160 [Acidobacteriaceae bacterium]
MSTFPHAFRGSAELVTKTIDDIIEGRGIVRLYGFIEYETLGFRFRKDFGYRWHAYGKLARLQSEQTDAERIALGYWAVDPERDKPEYMLGRNSADQ